MKNRSVSGVDQDADAAVELLRRVKTVEQLGHRHPATGAGAFVRQSGDTMTGTLITPQVTTPIVASAAGLALNPAVGGLTLNGRQARVMVDERYGVGGDTGAVPGVAQVTMISTGAVALRTGDFVLVSAGAWVITTTATLFTGVGVYVNGVQIGVAGQIDVVTGGAGWTIPVPPADYLVPGNGNYTITLRMDVPAGGNCRVVNSSMRVEVFATI